MINASNASLILALVPLTTAILAFLFLGEQLTKLRMIGFILALTGVFFIQGGSFSNMQLSQGELILFIAMFVQAISFIFVKRQQQHLIQNRYNKNVPNRLNWFVDH